MGILDDLSQATCSTCVWWQLTSANLGQCRHHSPVSVDPNCDPENYAVWPITAAAASCGDHQFRGADA